MMSPACQSAGSVKPPSKRMVFSPLCDGNDVLDVLIAFIVLYSYVFKPAVGRIHQSSRLGGGSAASLVSQQRPR